MASRPRRASGTDALVSELNQTNLATGNAVLYQRYAAGVVPPDPALGIHFGTINYDAEALVAWLRARIG